MRQQIMKWRIFCQRQGLQNHWAFSCLWVINVKINEALMQVRDRSGLAPRTWSFCRAEFLKWFSRGLNNVTNLMHSCEITCICLFKMKNHTSVCTDHCCANFFHFHVKPLYSFMKKHHWRSILADPNTPRWPIPQVGPAKELDTGRWHSPGKAEANRFCCRLVLAVATAALKGLEVSVN